MKKILGRSFAVLAGFILTASLIADQTPEVQPVPAESTSTVQTPAAEQQEPAPAEPAALSSTETQVAAMPPNEDNKPAQKIVYVYAQPPAADKSEAAAKPVQQGYHSDINNNPLLCFGRGLTNIATCWLEIPRCVIYDTKLIPVVGTIMGIPEGAGYTVVRALSGTADIITFGMDGGTFYGEYLPDFIWQANWEQPKKD